MEAYVAENPPVDTDPSDLNITFIVFPEDSTGAGMVVPQY